MRLRSLRDKTGETQVQVGKVLGKSREAVKKYEKGEREPDLASITKLAKHFNISVDYILGLTDVEYNPNDFYEIYFPDYVEFEEYFKDKNFVRYVRHGAKIYVHKLDIEYFEQLVDQMIQERKNKEKA